MPGSVPGICGAPAPLSPSGLQPASEELSYFSATKSTWHSSQRLVVGEVNRLSGQLS